MNVILRPTRANEHSFRFGPAARAALLHDCTLFGAVNRSVPAMGHNTVIGRSCQQLHTRGRRVLPPPRVTFRRVVAPLRGPGQSPGLPFACCVGSLRCVGRCGRCSCWCPLPQCRDGSPMGGGGAFMKWRFPPKGGGGIAPQNGRNKTAAVPV